MKILVNASNLVIGGGLQVARSLLIELSRMCGNGSLRCVVSKELASVMPADIKIDIVSPSPARILAGRKTRHQLTRIEASFDPDVVLSVFGPTYWKPQGLHVCGFAQPWIYTSNKYAWRTLSPLSHFMERIGVRYRRLRLFLDDVDAFITETNAMKEALKQVYPNTKIFVIPNNCGQSFYISDKSEKSLVMPKKEVNEFRIVTLTQYYSHKNLELIPSLSAILSERVRKIKPVFYLSLDEKSSGWRRIQKLAQKYGNTDLVRTVGHIDPSDAPFFYTGADAMFLPSVLESFSANYPEAMISGIPIVTTDLPFSRDICGTAALYFRPMDPFDASEKINSLIDNQSLAISLKKRGFERLRSFPTPEKKAALYLEACKSIWQETLS
jgi:glycosyltransferase involved in cell wall biosynthesis